MGRATLEVVTRHRWLHPVIYLAIGGIYIIRWVCARVGIR